MNENPPDNAVNGGAPLDEELVAYLDGELDAENARRIEALLASDPTVRHRLQSLERTWDLLDELDAAPLGEPFTQTTLEMVAIAAREEVEQSQAEAPRRRRRWLLGVGMGLLLAATAGFAAVALHDPDRQLLADLPLIENLDEYRQIGSIDFLRWLRDEKLPFTASSKQPQSQPSEEIAAARRERVRQMSLDAKERLLRAEDHFIASSPAEQQRLRRLHDDLCGDPDAPQLRAMMHAYYEWLQPLPAVVWAELAEGETKDRIAAVKRQLQEEQRRGGGWQPDAKDMAAIQSWMDNCIARHEAEFLKSLPNDQERKRFSQAGKTLRQWMFFGPGKVPPLITAEDLWRLREKLSPDASQHLKGKLPQQWRTVAAWLRQNARRQFEERGPHGRLSHNDDERLAEFFEKGLTVEQRDRLLAKPGEEMQRELQQLFWMHNRPNEGPGRRDWRPGEPGWPGRLGPAPLPPPMDKK